MNEVKSRNHYFKFRAHTADDQQSRVKDPPLAKDFYHRFLNNTSQGERKKQIAFNTFANWKGSTTQQSEINFNDDAQNGCLPFITPGQNIRKFPISSTDDGLEEYKNNSALTVLESPFQNPRQKVLIQNMYIQADSLNYKNNQFLERRVHESFYMKFKSKRNQWAGIKTKLPKKKVRIIETSVDTDHNKSVKNDSN